MEIKSEHIFSGLLAFFIIQFSKILAYVPIDGVNTLAYKLHYYPYHISYKGGGVWKVYGYYILLWLLITGLLFGIYKVFKYFKRSKSV